MSLIPMLFSNWWEDLDRPHEIFDQHFGLPLPVDALRSTIAPLEREALRPILGGRRSHYYRPYERSLSTRPRVGGTSIVQANKDKFHVTLDVQQFAPEEVTVKVVDNSVIIEGKHEDKQDEHGWISRQFSRKYVVPEQCDVEHIKTTLSSDGVLSIEAPRKHDPKEKKERVIPIERTGKLAIQVAAEQQQQGGSLNNGEQQQQQQQKQQTPRVAEKSGKNVKAA